MTSPWYPLGKLPATPARPKLTLAALTPSLPAPAAVVDMYSSVTPWPMYGNDQYGDCVEAGLGHSVEQITRYGQGATVRVTDQDVLDAYSAITGFNPDDPNSDQGTNVEDALSWWRKGAGMAGHAIVAYAAVDVSKGTRVKQAVQLFGEVGIGFNFPAYAMDQFNQGKPWDVQKANATIEGGHYVIVVGYDSAYFYVITWGAVQKMTPAFFAKYVDEGYVVIDDEMVSKVSQYVSGTDLHAFGQEFADLTGEANPFPDDPTPTPEPVPVGPTAADVVSAVQAALTPFQ
jgi:hypothetical protein